MCAAITGTVPESASLEEGVSYLRVSSKRQLNTGADVDKDGNSIATQREYTQSKARSTKVLIQREFVEPGKSAQSIDKRPVFKELLTYLKTHPEIKYVFIYQRSRAFRDYVDAGVTERQLNQMGVTLVSAKEDFGEDQIMARTMKAMTDIMNDAQVKKQGQDIAVKMAHKVKNGGTVGLANIGYLNRQIVLDDGRRVNSIVVDPIMAPLVMRAFELFGTGKHTLDSLHEIMGDAGLKAPHRNSPIGRETLSKMLRNRFYIGKVLYKGVEYHGRHEPLIDEELFDRVQRILDAHSGSGTRERTHPHYLKGLVWCGRCKHRFTLMPGRGNGGEYFYFLCRGRQQKLCDHPYVPAAVMEKLITQHYQTAVAQLLPEEVRAKVRAGVNAATSEYFELSDELRAQFDSQLDKLDRKESYFLDLAAEEEWPKDKLKVKLTAIRDEQGKIRRQLDQATNQCETGRTIFLTALALLERPGELYTEGNETIKSILNRALFSRIYVDGLHVTGHVLREPFDALAEAHDIFREHQAARKANQRHERTHYRHSGSIALTADTATYLTGSALPTRTYRVETANGADLPKEASPAGLLTWTDSLVGVLADAGSSKPVLVGLTGFEPATP